MGTLSKLADTFTREEQDTVLDALGGFKRDIQLEILERSGGDVDCVMDLRDQAMEGAFDVRKCSAGLRLDNAAGVEGADSKGSASRARGSAARARRRSPVASVRCE